MIHIGSHRTESTRESSLNRLTYKQTVEDVSCFLLQVGPDFSLSDTEAAKLLGTLLFEYVPVNDTFANYSSAFSYIVDLDRGPFRGKLASKKKSNEGEASRS